MIHGSFASLVERHRIAMLLCGIVVAAGVILPACGGDTSGPPDDDDPAAPVATSMQIIVTSSPGTGPVTVGLTRAYRIEVRDQFNAVMANETVATWSIVGPSTRASIALTGSGVSSGGLATCNEPGGVLVRAERNTGTVTLSAETALECMPAPTGSLTIIKDALPNDGQDFSFTSDNTLIPTFLLDDDGDATLSDRRVFASLPLGNYRVTEGVTAGWTLTGVTCTGGGVVDLGARNVTVAITAGANVVCTFTNTAVTGSITIVKDAVPNDAQDFVFTSTVAGQAAFSLDDDGDNTLSNTKVFAGLVAGSYTFTEAAVNGWTLSDVVCTPNTGITRDLPGRAATIALAPGANVTCTFINTAPVPVVTSVSTSPTTATATTPTVVTVTGLNFNETTRVSITVTPVNDPPQVFTIEGVQITTRTGTSLVFSFTSPIAGTASLRTQNGTGPMSNAMTFNIAAPAPPAASITGITPSSLTASSDPALLTISGANFGTGSTLTLRNTTAAVDNDCPMGNLPAQFDCIISSITSSQIVLSVTFGVTTAPSNWTAVVKNPGAAAPSGPFPFTLLAPSPAITSITTNPSPARSTTPSVVTVTGSNFSTTTARLVMTGPGCADGCLVPNSAFTMKTASSLVGPFTFPQAGTYMVEVENAGNSGSGGVMSGPKSGPVSVMVSGGAAGVYIDYPSSTIVGGVGTAVSIQPIFRGATGAETVNGCALTFSLISRNGSGQIVEALSDDVAMVSSSGQTGTVTGRAAGTTTLKTACADGSMTPFISEVIIPSGPLNVARVRMATPYMHFAESSDITLFRFSATAHTADGTAVPGAPITWSVSGSTAVSIDQTGLVTIQSTAASPRGPALRGGAKITAMSNGQRNVSFLTFGDAGALTGDGRIGIQYAGGTTVSATGAPVGGGVGGGSGVGGAFNGDGVYYIVGLTPGTYTFTQSNPTCSTTRTLTVEVVPGRASEIARRSSCQ